MHAVKGLQYAGGLILLARLVIILTAHYQERAPKNHSKNGLPCCASEYRADFYPFCGSKYTLINDANYYPELRVVQRIEKLRSK
jgi:hypothetical protein